MSTPADDADDRTDPNADDRTGSDADELTEEERQELLQEIERRRSVRGVTAVAVAAIAIAFSAFQLWIAARSFVFTLPIPVLGDVRLGSLQLLQVNTVHVAFALVLTFLLFPASTGRGFLSRRLARLVPALRGALGDGHPATRAAAGARAVLRWLVLDREMARVTPADLLAIALSVLAAGYTLTEFTEIRRMRALGMVAGRPVGEVYPIVEPLVSAVAALGLPLDEVPYAFVLGVVGVLLVLEATRRALGIYLMVIVASFVVYARYGYLIPQDAALVGVLSIPALGWDAIVQNLWYNTENGVFGIPVTVSVQFIYIFVLFGAFLEMSGSGRWFIDLAYAATGTRKGGPAKASILSSGFMGMISGSSIANTVTTGAFTIPLMKRSGYRAEFAGAVEASASSGGQILPPVMGAAAFLIVEYTLTPYADVIVAAAIPAIVFFFGVWVMVHLEASRAGIGGLSTLEIVDLRAHARRGWFYLVPLFLLLYYLIVARLSVARSAWFTIVAIVALVSLVAVWNERTRVPVVGAIVVVTALEVAAFATRGVGLLDALAGGGPGMPLGAAAAAAVGRLGWIVIAVSVVTLLVRPRLEAPLLDYDEAVDVRVEEIAGEVGLPRVADLAPARYLGFVLGSMDSGARTATTVVIAVAAAGIIPGVVSVSGLGPNLTALLLALAGGSLVVLLVFTAIASIILGMGMPTTVTYIILVSMLAPPISEGFAIPILAVHLFILYFGVIADITPPVAVAAYAASGIAKSDQFQTGVLAFSLSLNKAIVPFAFVLAPGILLLRGTGTGQEVRIIGLSDVLDVGFFVPEVAVPIVAIFVGVVALGATVIGFLYTDVGRAERAGFAVSALLLMAPGLVLDPLQLADSLAFGMGLRLVGAALFVLLVVANRRSAGGETAPAAAAEADAA